MSMRMADRIGTLSAFAQDIEFSQQLGIPVTRQITLLNTEQHHYAPFIT